MQRPSGRKEPLELKEDQELQTRPFRGISKKEELTKPVSAMSKGRRGLTVQAEVWNNKACWWTGLRALVRKSRESRSETPGAARLCQDSHIRQRDLGFVQ